MSTKTRVFASLLAVLIAGVQCGGTDGGQGPTKPVPQPPPTACNPIAAEWDCLFPYPSDYFLVADESTPAGRRLVIPEVALPQMVNGGVMAIDKAPVTDGFSLLPQIAVHIPGGITATWLPGLENDPAFTTTIASPTLLIDTTTGELLLHDVEVELGRDKDSPMLVIRPLVRLNPNTRYVVALHSLKNDGGASISPPKVFLQLREGTADSEALQKKYDKDVFPVVTGAGLARDSVTLAWDFTTRSEANLMADLLAIRTDAMQRFENEPPVVTITEVKDDVNDSIARQVEGTLRVPLYLTHAEPGAFIYRGEDGAPAVNGTAEVPFTVLIPHSVAKNPDGTARLLQFGHGFFGTRREIEDGFVSPFVDQTQMVVIGVDWWGMSAPDMDGLLDDLLDDPISALNFTERVHQAFVNFMAVTYAAQSTLTKEAAMTLDGQLVYDPEHVYFYGLSMGHILGGTYMALSPHIERAVLSSGGAGFSLIMAHSLSFDTFKIVLNSMVEGSMDTTKYVSLGLTLLDRIDAITYAPYVLDTPLEGSPAKRYILQHGGIGDERVPTLSAHTHARALGLAHQQPSPRPIAGLTQMMPPIDGSAFVEFDFGLDDQDPEAFIPKFINVHEELRRLQAAIKQIDAFLQPGGLIKNYCSNACNPE